MDILERTGILSALCNSVVIFYKKFTSNEQEGKGLKV